MTVHFGGPPLTVHKAYCGVPTADLSGNVYGDRPNEGPPVDCPDCLGKVAKFDAEAEKWED